MSGILSKRLDQFVETEIDDEVVAMSLASGDFFSLKDSALAIWRAIDGQTDRVALTATIAADYGVEAGDIAADVDAFIESAKAAGLLDEG